MARMMDSLIVEPFPPFAFTKITTTTHRSSGRNGNNLKKSEGNSSKSNSSGANTGTGTANNGGGSRSLGGALGGLLATQTCNQEAAVGLRMKSQVPTQGKCLLFKERVVNILCNSLYRPIFFKCYLIDRKRGGFMMKKRAK